MKEIIIKQTNNGIVITLVENGVLLEKYEETLDSNKIEGNIYLGKIVNVLPGMQAAFVDIGEDKNAFLHIKEILKKVDNKTGNKNEKYEKYNISDFVKVGMPVIVEVKKDREEKKGAKLSTHLNIPGRFVAFMPDADFITISQKIEDEKEIIRLKDIISKINNQKHGIIVRTSAEGRTQEEIVEDFDEVLEKYKQICQKAKETKKIPNILYKSEEFLFKFLRDNIDHSIEKIIVDNENISKEIFKILQKFKSEISVEIYNKGDVFDIYNLNAQIEKINNRKIWLKSGAFITIDKTEALTAIDVNTGKYIGKESLAKTVLKVNEEATIEIAKQIRLRDIGGIIIIDYIDMEEKEDEIKIEQILKKCLKQDRAKTQMVGFTPLHLYEMTRRHIYGNEKAI